MQRVLEVLGSLGSCCDFELGASDAGVYVSATGSVSALRV